MRLSWSCGVFVGFILAMLLAGAAYYYFCIKTNPELSQKSMQQLEDGWSKTKSSGDQVIEKIRPYAAPQQETPPPSDTSAQGGDTQ